MLLFFLESYLKNKKCNLTWSDNKEIVPSELLYLYTCLLWQKYSFEGRI